jgi:hypothetical protein
MRVVDMQTPQRSGELKKMDSTKIRLVRRRRI